MRLWGWAVGLALVAVVAGCTSSHATSTAHTAPATRGSTTTPVLVTKAMSIAAINAACTSFYRFDPGDLASSPTLAASKAFARARLRSIDAALGGVDAVPLRKADEPLRETVRDNLRNAATIYEQVTALPSGSGANATSALDDEAQRLVVGTAVALIRYGATSCVPSSSSGPTASPASAGPVIDLAPTAVIKVAEPLLDNNSIAADGDAVWVGVKHGRRVVRIDPATSAVTARVELGAEIAQPVELVDGNLWVETTTEFVRINPATNRIDWRLSLLGLALPGDDFAVTSDSLWVCDRDVVHRVDIASKRRGTDVPAGGGCKGGTLIATEQTLLASVRSGDHVRIARFEVATGKLEGSVELPLQADWGLMQSPDGHVFLDSMRTYELDIESGQIVRSTLRGGLPGNQLALGGGGLWLTRPAEHRVVREDLASGRLEEIIVGAGPNGIAYVDGNIWVTNSDDGTVMRFRVDPWPAKR